MATEIPYGWLKDRPDERDYKYAHAYPNYADVELPSIVDLRDQFPPVYTQGSYQSCTGHAIGAAFVFEQKKQNLPDFSPSRLFIYYNERFAEGDVTVDGGAQIRNGIKCVAQLGVCNEELWPYTSNVFEKPGDHCYQDALNNQLEKYYSLDGDLKQLKHCIADGSPFVFGIRVYRSFESPIVAKTGIVPMPLANDQLLGGHAVLAVGYNDTQNCFIIRNSWGPNWGDQGHFYLPYNYVTSWGSDFWVIKLVE